MMFVVFVIGFMLGFPVGQGVESGAITFDKNPPFVHVNEQ